VFAGVDAEVCPQIEKAPWWREDLDIRHEDLGMSVEPQTPRRRVKTRAKRGSETPPRFLEAKRAV